MHVPKVALHTQPLSCLAACCCRMLATPGAHTWSFAASNFTGRPLCCMLHSHHSAESMGMEGWVGGGVGINGGGSASCHWSGRRVMGSLELVAVSCCCMQYKAGRPLHSGTALCPRLLRPDPVCVCRNHALRGMHVLRLQLCVGSPKQALQCTFRCWLIPAGTTGKCIILHQACTAASHRDTPSAELQPRATWIHTGKPSPAGS